MIRLHVVVEGQTEEGFVNQVLADHLGQFDISTDVRSVETSRTRRHIFRGGAIDYGRVRRDLGRWMGQDRHEDSYFTTMIDLYALPDDFPGFADARSQQDAYQRVLALERAFASDLGHPRFIPYIQLHEFEALILADPQALDWEFVEYEREIAKLVEMAGRFASPELINEQPETAPSKRIIAEISDYDGRKASAGPLVVRKIGLEAIRQKCSHFDGWVSLLEELGRSVRYRPSSDG